MSARKALDSLRQRELERGRARSTAQPCRSKLSHLLSFFHDAPPMAYNNYNGSGYDRTQYPSNDNPFDPPTAYDSHVPARYPPQTYENNDYAASRDSLASDYDVGGYSNAPAAARGYGTEKAYPEAAAKGGSHVKRWVAVAVGVLVLAGIATGVAVGRVNASKDGGSGSGSGSGTSSGTKLQVGLALFSGTWAGIGGRC